ncbi:unnamed protein product, partial [Mycena citricolor]
LLSTTVSSSCLSLSQPLLVSWPTVVSCDLTLLSCL